MSASSQQRTYPQGVPCWVDIERDDPQSAADFYAELFGWQLERATPPDAPFVYFIAQLDGRDVCGIGSSGGLGGEWKTYVAVDDCDAMTQQASDAGAIVLGEPADAGPGGRWSELLDPQGARVRLWQARRRLGAQIVNQPGAWNFSDLHTPDIAASKGFYGPLFGWQFMTGGFEGARVPGYGEHLADGADPEIFERNAHAPEGFADVVASITADGDPHWQVTFAVADRDATADRARDLGAEIAATAEDDWTRKVTLRDPDGAVFVASQFTPPDDWGLAPDAGS